MQNQVKALKIPHWPETGIAANWERMKELPGFMDFIPEEWHPKHHKIERGFIWSVAIAVAEGWVVTFLRDLRQQKELSK